MKSGRISKLKNAVGHLDKVELALAGADCIKLGEAAARLRWKVIEKILNFEKAPRKYKPRKKK